jgi:hypothetical protein
VGGIISKPREAAMSLTSTRCIHPKDLRISFTVSLAPGSFPQMKTSWSPGTSEGLTITGFVIVLVAFTTFASGNVR